MKGKDGISRAIYVTARGRRVVIVRVLLKKAQKTPRREIDLALERVKGDKPMSQFVWMICTKRWMKDSKYRREYKALGKRVLSCIGSDRSAHPRRLTQELLARRMETTQAVIARLEGGGSKPSTRTPGTLRGSHRSRCGLPSNRKGARP